MTVKYFTGKDYPQLCSGCRQTVDYIASMMSELPDEYAADEEGPIMYVYDHRLYCGGHECVNKEENDVRE